LLSRFSRNSILLTIREEVLRRISRKSGAVESPTVGCRLTDSRRLHMRCSGFLLGKERLKIQDWIVLVTFRAVGCSRAMLIDRTERKVWT